MRNIYQTALDVQDACNMSGVLFSFAECMKTINAEMREQGKGEDYRRKHPVVILFLSKLNDMAGFSTDTSFSSFLPAYDACKEKAAS